MKLTAAANLLSQHSHAILNDCNDFETLKKVLSLAFPEDVEEKKYELHTDDEGSYYGYDLRKRSNWANIGDYLERLQIIKLSDIIEDEDSNDEMQVVDSFEQIVDETLQQIRETLIVKGKEYRRNNNPYHNFEVGARKKNISREKALDGMLLKHEVSIEDMTNDLDTGKLPSIETVNEKFNDNIIYLLIKKAMMIDRVENDK